MAEVSLEQCIVLRLSLAEARDLRRIVDDAPGETAAGVFNALSDALDE